MNKCYHNKSHMHPSLDSCHLKSRFRSIINKTYVVIISGCIWSWYHRYIRCSGLI